MQYHKDIEFNVGGCDFHATNMISSVIIDSIPTHSHGANCYEIHYISDGYGLLNANGQEYRIVPNTLYITGPLIAHSQFSDLKQPMHEWCIYITADYNRNEKYDNIAAAFLSRQFWIGQDKQGLMQVLEKFFTELNNKQNGYKNMSELLLSELIILIVRNYEKTSNAAAETEASAYERTSIITEEYFLYEYKNASLDKLAEKLGLSSRQTQRVLLKNYGKSFSQMKNQARMSAAEIMLSDKRLSLSDISERLGYSSQEYFTAAFKKHFGATPGNFRRKL